VGGRRQARPVVPAVLVARHDVEVIIDAPADVVARCLPRTTGQLEQLDDGTTRLVGSTSNPVWYAQQLALIPASYRINRCPDLSLAARVLGQRLITAAENFAEAES
jgi:hypothetical protein